MNVTTVREPFDKCVVYLDPEKFPSTWLGNKAIYRTRMAMADDGELVILAPGVRTFGEDPEIDRLIRKYGYLTTPEVLAAVATNDDLKQNLSAAAHLIHGSSEGRFRITYCPGGLTPAGDSARRSTNTATSPSIPSGTTSTKLRDGWNELPGGERVFFVRDPAMGLWKRV